MKKIIIILDGALDEFLEQQTPLMQANINNINNLLRQGDAFRLNTVQDGEDINSLYANMTILGIKDREAVPGRPALEALSLGIDIPKNSYLFRLNLLCLNEHGIVASTVGGGVNSAEHKEIKRALNLFFKPLNIIVYDLHEHAFLLVSPVELGGVSSSNISNRHYHSLLEQQPKHLMMIQQIEHIFSGLKLNTKRGAGQQINSALIWGESRLSVRSKKNNPSTAVITATPIVDALAKYAGYRVYKNPVFTGDETTDLLGKANLAVDLLVNHDTVFCHIDGLDYVSHKCERDKKIKFLEKIDSDYFGTLINRLNRVDQDIQLIVLPDHGTSSLTGAHIYSVVPGFKTKMGNAVKNSLSFDENLAKDKPVVSFI